MSKWIRGLINHAINESHKSQIKVLREEYKLKGILSRAERRDNIVASVLPAVWESIGIPPQNMSFSSYASEASVAVHIIADAVNKKEREKQ